jgi:hypothetical protein
VNAEPAPTRAREIDAGGYRVVVAAGLRHEYGRMIAAMPSPAGVSAPVRVRPTVTSGSSIFFVYSWQASLRRAAL